MWSRTSAKRCWSRRGDPADVASALSRLLDAPEERASLGRAAAMRQAAEYDLDATVRQVELLYGELLDRL